MRSATALRAATVFLATGFGGWLAVRLAVPAAFGLLNRDRTFEQTVTGICGLLLLACTAWAVLAVCAGLLAGLLSLLPHHGGIAVSVAALDRCSPAVVRGFVATFLGVSIAAGVAGPSLAASTTPRPRPGIAGLDLPDRVEGAAPAGTATKRGSTSPDPVVVRSGDSLWAIARRRLPGVASDALTARATQRLYAANRSRIGADPNFIVPGTRLVLPDPDISHRKDRP